MTQRATSDGGPLNMTRNVARTSELSQAPNCFFNEYHWSTNPTVMSLPDYAFRDGNRRQRLPLERKEEYKDYENFKGKKCGDVGDCFPAARPSGGNKYVRPAASSATTRIIVNVAIRPLSEKHGVNLLGSLSTAHDQRGIDPFATAAACVVPPVSCPHDD